MLSAVHSDLQGMFTRQQASLATKMEALEGGSLIQPEEAGSDTDTDSIKEGSLEKGLSKASLGKKVASSLHLGSFDIVHIPGLACNGLLWNLVMATHGTWPLTTSWTAVQFDVHACNNVGLVNFKHAAPQSSFKSFCSFSYGKRLQCRIASQKAFENVASSAANLQRSRLDASRKGTDEHSRYVFATGPG